MREETNSIRLVYCFDGFWNEEAKDCEEGPIYADDRRLHTTGHEEGRLKSEGVVVSCWL